MTPKQMSIRRKHNEQSEEMEHFLQHSLNNDDFREWKGRIDTTILNLKEGFARLEADLGGIKRSIWLGIGLMIIIKMVDWIVFHK